MELKPLTHFFNKRIYIVPDYQRGYSWKEKEILDLLTDIDHVIQLDSFHYTGTITIHNQNDKERIGLNNYEKYHIVDGQQRFTSIILVLSYLIKELQDDEKLRKDVLDKKETYIINRDSYLFRYGIDKVSENYFRSIILENEDLISLEENLYTRNLLEAKKTIKKYFTKEENKNRLVEFLNAIEEKLLFNEYIVSNTAEIGVVFETMNNRGIDLSNLEIVKNRLLYLTSKIKISAEKESSIAQLSKSINSKWAIILKNLTLPDRVLDEDTFLNNHWIIYNGWSKDNQARKEILDDEFSIGKMVEDPKKMIEKIKGYINSLATTSLHWRFINYPQEDKSFVQVKDSDTKNELKNYFGKLNRLNNSTVRPILLAFMPLMKAKANELLELVKLAEIFSFRLFSMNRRRSDTGKNDIYRNCKRFHKGVHDEYTFNDACFYLAWYIDNYGGIDRFEIEVEELFRSPKKQGYYSWRGLSYFLFEYEEFLRGNEKNKVSYDFASSKKKSIEHILPQTVKNTEWETTVKGIKIEQLKRVTHALGNLVLIDKDKNSSLRNNKFSIKKDKYQLGSYSENNLAQKYDTWSLENISKREETILKFLKNRWGLNEGFLNTYPNPDELEDEIFDDYENE